MKCILLNFCILVLGLTMAFSQAEDNEAIQVIGGAHLMASQAGPLADALKSKKRADIFNQLRTAVSLESNFAKDSIGDFYRSRIQLIAHLNDIASGDRNTAVIIIYRDLSPVRTPAGVLTGYDADFEVTNSMILRRDWAKEGFQNYLLNTKNIILVYVDVAKSFYESTDSEKEPLFATRLDIRYKDSFFKKSFKELISTTSSLGVMGGGPIGDVLLNVTIAKLSPRRIKAPCAIELSNKTFKEPLSFDIHENNIGSFQIGLVNTKFDKKNFEITGGNLIVKADSAEKAAWKSNLYALMEIHLPRDIDNYEPIWKAATMKYGASRKWKVWNRLYKITFDRIGFYGGVKISKDPLSNIYYGFNYALTKELAVNFGWTLTNEVVPQVTTVGSISSVPDALEYAKREYSKPVFSWGLSFSPGALSKTLGLAGKDE